MTDVPEEEILDRFVCGDLTDEEKSSLEQQFFADDELFDRLVEAENDLVDAFAGGRLAGNIRAAFEKRLSESPRLKERVELAKALRDVRPAGARTARPVFALALAAAVILGLGTTWVVLQSQQQLRRERGELIADSGRLRDELARLQETSRGERARWEEAMRALVPRDTAAPAGRVASFALATGLTRGGTGANRLVVSGDTETVVLELPTEADGYDRYRVTIETPEGGKVAVLDGLPRPTRPAKTLRVSVPASLLSDGDYVLSVAGLRDGSARPAAEFAFRVVRK